MQGKKLKISMILNENKKNRQSWLYVLLIFSLSVYRCSIYVSVYHVRRVRFDEK